MLTRKDLKDLGLEDAQIESIISKHTDTVTALKDERDKLKADAEKLPAVQTELDNTKKKLTEAQTEAKTAKENAAAIQKKLDEAPDYEALKAEYDGYKADIAAKQVSSSKTAALMAALKAAGASEAAAKLMLNGVELDKVELDENGALKDENGAIEPLKTQYSDFFGKEHKEGLPPTTPPSGKNNVDYDSMSDEEFFRAKEQENKKS